MFNEKLEINVWDMQGTSFLTLFGHTHMIGVHREPSKSYNEVGVPFIFALFHMDVN